MEIIKNFIKNICAETGTYSEIHNYYKSEDKNQQYFHTTQKNSPLLEFKELELSLYYTPSLCYKYSRKLP